MDQDPSFSKRRPYSIMDNQWYTVVLRVLVWPNIYNGKLSYSFPTEKAALRFAKKNVSPRTPAARIYSPTNELLTIVGNPFA